MAEKASAVQLNLSYRNSHGEAVDTRFCPPGIYQVILEVIANPELLTIKAGENPVFIYNLITTLMESEGKPALRVVLTTEAQITPGTTRYVMGELTLKPGTLYATTHIWTGRHGEANSFIRGDQWTTTVRD